jgi:glycosyltransferase involved in cell wall biosynthesis
MQTTPDMDVRIIVVENDQKNRSESILEEFSATGKFSISYYLESEQGLVYARNRSVKESGDCDFCCFTDDDEVVTSDWLIELINCQKEFNAAGVTGPTYPVLNNGTPAYIRDFHTPKPHMYGTVLETAFTGCLLMRKDYLDMIEGPFDKRLSFSGGEDIYLTYLISNRGGEIRYNPKAITYETFPEERSSINYVIKRAYRNSNTGMIVRSLRGERHFKLKSLPRLVIRFCYGLLIVVPLYIYGGKNKLQGLIKIVNAIGGFHFISGRHNRFYK